MNIIIADNSVIFRQILNDILCENNHSVILKCSNGKQVVQKASSADTDLVILGENISGYNEYEASEKLQSIGPVPVILFFNKEKADSDKIKNFSGTTIPRPDMELINEKEYQKDLLEKIGNLGMRKKSTRTNNKNPVTCGALGSRARHIVIGSSTGGPNALKKILDFLPGNFPASVSVVQHMEKGHEENLARWLDRSSRLKVRLVKDHDKALPGEVLIAEQGRHLVVQGGELILTDGEKINYQKPAVDRLFETAALEHRGDLAGVLLTGMGNDGAKGCLEIIKNGGFTIVQDKTTCAVFGMPKAAIDLEAASCVLPLEKIAEKLIQITGQLK